MPTSAKAVLELEITKYTWKPGRGFKRGTSQIITSAILHWSGYCTAVQSGKVKFETIRVKKIGSFFSYHKTG